MFETQRKKITVKYSRLESVLILKHAFLLRFPQFAWLDGAGLIVYWGAWCWSGTDLPTKCKSLYYTHHLRVCTSELSVWNHVFTVNIDLFEVARNIRGFLRSNRLNVKITALGFLGIIRKINVQMTSCMVWEYLYLFNLILNTDLYGILRSL